MSGWIQATMQQNTIPGNSCNNIESKSRLLANTRCYISDVQSSKKMITFSNEHHKNSWNLMQQYWKQSRFKQIPDVRVPRNRATKNISLRFPSSRFILNITSVPEFISNYIRTAYSIKRVVLNLILDSCYISS